MTSATLRAFEHSATTSARLKASTQARHHPAASLYLRILYAFDPKRKAYLLLGGAKTGDDRFYERMVPIAEKIYKRHLEEG